MSFYVPMFQTQAKGISEMLLGYIYILLIWINFTHFGDK